MCISLFIALLIAALLLFAIFGFITVGTLSASVLVGIHKKSFTTGFRTFLLFFCTLAFTVIGCVSFWFLNRMMHWWTETKAISIGLGVGLVSGMVTGISLAFLIKKLSAFLKQKWESRSAAV